MKKYTKEEAIKAVKRMIAEKKEVIRWMNSNESYTDLKNKGITLGKIGD
ncbi:MAG: hypothetical protein LUE99_05265 [Bacteroides sp.]|nr:hypothetical protein [Bacteroides sp.]